MAMESKKKYKSMMKRTYTKKKKSFKKGQKTYVDFDIMQKEIDVNNINKESLILYRKAHMSYKQWIEHYCLKVMGKDCPMEA